MDPALWFESPKLLDLLEFRVFFQAWWGEPVLPAQAGGPTG